VPEVNPDAIDGYAKKNIIANPNCSTAQLVVALKPLHDAATSASSFRPISRCRARARKAWMCFSNRAAHLRRRSG
jgi:aspartate-semialdehyde dehydrogenase